MEASQIQYIGEHLWAGETGNIFIIIAFTASLLASVSFFRAFTIGPEQQGWLRLGRVAFRIHSAALGTCFDAESNITKILDSCFHVNDKLCRAVR